MTKRTEIVLAVILSLTIVAVYYLSFRHEARQLQYPTPPEKPCPGICHPEDPNE